MGFQPLRSRLCLSTMQRHIFPLSEAKMFQQRHLQLTHQSRLECPPPAALHWQRSTAAAFPMLWDAQDPQTLCVPQVS